MIKLVFTYRLDRNPEPIRQKVNARNAEEGEKLLRLIFAGRLIEIIKIEEERIPESG